MLRLFLLAVLPALLGAQGPGCGGCGGGRDPAAGDGTAAGGHCHWLEVTGVTPGSPGESAGVLPGDAIVSYGGRTVGCLGDLNRTRAMVADDTVELIVRRNGREVTLLLPAGGHGIRFREWQQDIELDSDAVTIPDVPRLDLTDEGLNSFMAALEAVVGQRGGEADYVFLCGVSGAAFRTQFHDGWRVDSPDAQVGYDNTAPALAACGLSGSLRRISTDGKNWPAVRTDIRTSIDAGMPVLVVGPGGGPGWAVIAGYQHDGEELLGRTGNSARKGYDIVGGLPSAVVILEEAGARPEPRTSYRRSFAIVTASLSVEKHGGYYVGLTAFDRWIAELVSDDLAGPDSARLREVRDANHRYLRRLVHDRETGIEFLRRVAQELPRLSPRLDTLARLYAEEVEHLAAVLPGPGGPAGESWTEAARDREVAALEQARRIEARALPLWRLLAAAE